MKQSSREEKLERLAEAAEAASTENLEGSDGILLNTMRILGVKLGHFIEMCEVLIDGKWATTEDPYAYVAEATRNVARRQGRGEAKFLEIADGAQLEWEAEKASGGSAGHGLSYRELVRRLPEEFKIVTPPSLACKAEIDRGNALSGPDTSYFHIGPVTSPNYAAWAHAAGLSEFEQKALNFMVAGVSRDDALKRQPDETTRKALQAAYRRLRRRGFGQLNAAVPPRTADQKRRTSNSNESGWYSHRPGSDPHPPKSVIAGITPTRIVQENQPFDHIPWWSAPVPRKKTK